MFRTLLKFVGGVALGGLVGAVAGVLLAPASGPELKQGLQDYWDAAVAAGEEAQEERHRTLQSQFDQARQFKRTG